MVFLYTTLESSAGKRLHNIVKSLVPLKEILVFQTMNDFLEGIHQQKEKPGIVVFVADNREQLLDILSSSDLFWNPKTILILPDRNKETISKGLKLYPRFIDYIDSDFSNVALVLKKMMKKARIEYEQMYEEQEDIDSYGKGEAKIFSHYETKRK